MPAHLIVLVFISFLADISRLIMSISGNGFRYDYVPLCPFQSGRTE